MFMIGVGAIGCELLKNFAMLSICTVNLLFFTFFPILKILKFI